MKDMRRVNMTGTLTLLTGLTYSNADDALKNKTKTLLPRTNGSCYVPSTLIIGRWRHTCVHMILEHLKRQGKKLRLSDQYWAFIGGIKDGGESPYDVLSDLPIYHKHVSGSFWGHSEPVFMQRKLQVEDARSIEGIIEAAIIYGQRTDPVQKGEVRKDTVSDPGAFDDYLDRLEAARTGRKAAAEADKGRRKNGGKNGGNDADKVIIPQAANMPHAREIIPPDHTLHLSMDITRPTAVQMGMFLATLRMWSQDPFLGAKAGRNLGLVDLECDVITDRIIDKDGVTGLEREALGKIKVFGRDRHIELSEPLLAMERLFWEQFDSIDFTKPVIKAKLDAA